jgi:hypothetical protein
VSVFNSENRCRGVPPVSLSLSALGLLVSKPSACGTTRPRRALKASSRQRCVSRAQATPPPIARSLASPHAPPTAVSEAAAALLPTVRVPVRHAAVAFATSARVSAPRRRVFTLSRPRSPLFRRRVLRLPAASPLLRLPA